eukprot:GFYU01019796.1.p1 GENE.GFYU01019796.1~~GFYU01019796.1.p1  ORF type:complete len:487 (+),score=64.08 GFYU01019796.1:19-1479(+)
MSVSEASPTQLIGENAQDSATLVSDGSQSNVDVGSTRSKSERLLQTVKGIPKLFHVPKFANPELEETFRCARTASSLHDRRLTVVGALVVGGIGFCLVDEAYILYPTLYWTAVVLVLAPWFSLLIMLFMPWFTEEDHYTRNDTAVAVVIVISVAGTVLENYAYTWTVGEAPYHAPSTVTVAMMLCAPIIGHLPARVLVAINVCVLVTGVITAGVVTGKVGDVLFYFLAVGSTAVSATIAGVVSEKEARHHFLLRVAVHNEMNSGTLGGAIDVSDEKKSLRESLKTESQDAVMYKWTLRFRDSDFEREFQIERATQKMAFTRRVSAFVTLQYIFMAIQDVFTTMGTKYDDVLPVLLVVRFGIVLPSMLICFGLTWWSKYPQYRSMYIIPVWCLVWALGDIYVMSLFPVLLFQMAMYSIVLTRIMMTIATVLQIDYVASVVVMCVIGVTLTCMSVFLYGDVSGVALDWLFVIIVSCGLGLCRTTSELS